MLGGHPTDKTHLGMPPSPSPEVDKRRRQRELPFLPSQPPGGGKLGFSPLKVQGHLSSSLVPAGGGEGAGFSSPVLGHCTGHPCARGAQEEGSLAERVGLAQCGGHKYHHLSAQAPRL